MISSVDNTDGKCFARFMIPDEYKTVNKQVEIRPASQKIEIIPAEYETVQEQRIIKPESKKLIQIPAEFEEISQKVVIEPETRSYEIIPAVYDTIIEPVMIKEASKKFVYVPAVYKTIQEQILIKEESKRLINIPADYSEVEDRILVQSEYEMSVPVPAEYETISEKYEVRPSYIKLDTIAPKYKYESDRVMVKPASTKWVQKKGDKSCLSEDPADCLIWCLIEVPAEYNTVSKLINIGCDGSGVENSGCINETIVPAQYAYRDKRIVKREAEARTVSNKPIYTTVSRTVLKNAATVKEEMIPAVYGTVSKQVIETPARTEEIEIPAIYENRQKIVLKKAAQSIEKVIPAVYKTVNRRVLKTPASTRIEIIPAEYETVEKQIIKKQESSKTIDIPAQYSILSEKILVKKGAPSWRQIVCTKDQTPELIGALQTRLKDIGFNPGKIDHLYGPLTYKALVNFQNSRGLVSGIMDYATLEELGMELPGKAANAPSDFSFPDQMNAQPIAANETADVLTNKGGTENMERSEPYNNLISGFAKKKDIDQIKKEEAEQEENEEELKEDGNESIIKLSPKEKEKMEDVSFLSTAELEMVNEINLLRSNPQGYIKHVNAYINEVLKDDKWGEDFKKEEMYTSKELIAELNKLGPLPILTTNESLYTISIEHGKDMQTTGNIDHKGSDGRMPLDRIRDASEIQEGTENIVGGFSSVRNSVITLLVDSGIQNRGHRKTLLDPKWTQVACYKVGDVGEMSDTWIQMFGK